MAGSLARQLARPLLALLAEPSGSRRATPAGRPLTETRAAEGFRGPRSAKTNWSGWRGGRQVDRRAAPSSLRPQFN